MYEGVRESWFIASVNGLYSPKENYTRPEGLHDIDRTLQYMKVRECSTPLQNPVAKPADSTCTVHIQALQSGSLE